MSRNEMVKKATDLMALAIERRERGDATWQAVARKAANYLEDAGLRGHAAKIRREAK